MNMKRLVLSALILIAISRVLANDSLKIINLQREVSNLKVSVSRLQQENGKIRSLYQQQKTNVDSLFGGQKQQTENLNVLADKVGIGLSETNKNIQDSQDSLSSSINTRTWLAVCVILIVLALLGVVYSILRKRINSGSSAIDKIKSAQEGLEVAQKAMQEESVKLDNKLVELLDKQVATQPQSGNNDQPDHSLALKVADEIVRIETNLSRMDESVKGYKQLKKAVERIRTNFLANGYEIVEMLGKAYSEGMKASVNFETDESLKEGEQKITGIIKPQINYKGKMIQTAQITVSQNL
jgi:endonuclease/exonuclease/phosphatase (EEP) superfamily protein YafD